MVTRRLRNMWTSRRSRRFTVSVAIIAIILSGIPALFAIGPMDLAIGLPLTIYAIFLTLVGARHSLGLALVVAATVCLPIFVTLGDDRLEAIRNALFISVAALALSWAHRRQRTRLQRRARVRRRLVGRVKNRAKQLQKTGSELRQAVERSEVAHRTLLEHLPVHVLQKDLDGRFSFVSQSFSRLLGHEVEEILGKTDYDFYEPDIAEKFRQDDERVKREGKIVDDIERTQLSDGTVAYMQVRKAPLRDSRGMIVGVQGIFWDVTEALSGRKQLQRIESWAHALIQAALDAVLIVDVEGRVLEANPAAETILGYRHQRHGSMHPPLGEIMRTTVGDLSVADQPQTALSDSATFEPYVGTEQGELNRLLKRATGRRIEVRLRRQDETWFEAEISAHPLVVENSSGWAIFIRDITRRKRSVAELQAAKEAAERANLAKSEFVANVSHELRTPLTGIVGLHELLERTALDDQQREYLMLARTSSNNLLALIDALLDFSKIEAHRLELEHETFDLIECIESAASSLAARAQLRGLELMVDIGKNLPQYVRGDAPRVRQILLNLIGNAIKFTQRGDICVRATLSHDPGDAIGLPTQSNDGNAIVPVQFEVIDAGIGIAEETQAVIFEAFRQADSSTTRRYGGTGLGLAICRELVTLMGGTISVNSVPQVGSTFTFTLPLELSGSALQQSIDPIRLRAIKIALVTQASRWSDILLRDLQDFGCDVTRLTPSQLVQREPPHLFVAGNHTVVIADFRELSAEQPKILPVVERIVLAVPMALARPSQPPDWLRHANFSWLQRPIEREDLMRALLDEPIRVSHGETERSANEALVRSADILLVEDSPINQTVLKGILSQLGHTVTLAQNGAEAVSKCASHKFDVVLMDIQMPEVDGLEATRLIRSDELTSGRPETYIIALTAHAMPSDREQSKAAGMNGFLVKPISMEALRQALAVVPGLTQLDSHQDNVTRVSIPAEDRSGVAVVNAIGARRWPEWPEIEETLGGNASLAREVVALLVTEAPRLFQQFVVSVERREAKEARRYAHTLKSNLRNVALAADSELAGQFEHWSQHGDWVSIESRLSELERSIDEIVEWGRDLVSRTR